MRNRLVISACGNRGPLYLPDDVQAAKPAVNEPQSVDTDSEDEEEDEAKDVKDLPTGTP